MDTFNSLDGSYGTWNFGLDEGGLLEPEVRVRVRSRDNCWWVKSTLLTVVCRHQDANS